MSDRNLFLRGAFILAVAGIVSKLMGSIYTLFLQNIIGDRGLGLYQMAYPIYSTLLLLSTAGIPVAVSKFVAEHMALGDYRGAKKVFRVASVILFISGILCFFLLWFGAELFARISGDEGAKFAIQALAPALMVVPVMASIRGYFQGWQQMEPTAVSQVVEQLIRVATIIGAAWLLLRMGYSEEWAAAGAAFGAVTGAFAALLVLVGYVWNNRVLFRHDVQMPNRVPPQSNRTVIKKLIMYAIPVSLGALVVPFMNNVDVITVANMLKQAGYSQDQATELFGLLSGRAFKLMMLPATIATAIGVALMPAIAGALAVGEKRVAYQRIELALRWTIIIGLPASVGLFLLAEPIDITLFKDSSGTPAIMAISFATLFSSLQLTTTAILQGIGYVYRPVRNLLIGGVFKLIFNIWLVPKYGIEGAAVSTVLSFSIAALLNFWDINRLSGLSFNWRLLLWGPSIATFLMGVAVFASLRQMGPYFFTVLPERLAGACLTLAVILFASAVYGIALLASGSLRKEDIRSIPRIGQKLADLFAKIGLVR
ncbi:putative polysaccharide biosynthesis protein [Effusibacillus dendaii]|uniref:Stage V sporulation protein B n=1 Tax=Effusibacillus dendaii TaxID=2743772 RepID=A0A7I8DBE4_9BACL|nr:polysaccharide biosynthesis protein [Effusibacillus dendaii]BCJ87405.1 stage V sporulation protein B [Effusibacillus dendaii]